ncbi:NAD(P)-dependent dehydrogenase (short-subunit alcohol dehydrogenase family) [Cryobacterium sp. MP_M5]|uniref:SDR family NAD(P)-dependent oxidoreductase n=1 Tax=unclassified Cryobacterium TaxID=2649013 RepID=UPI0018CA39A0|nr:MULTISPECIES: SDR family NAD(P)-dependent oxidoreductase [unclassified Cryobacterium]MBG6057380.1 NAD(P)-dependent dehydrogenase (short-subunit alcohol dehydrogenase family) [Cryobacterium sp. MP_M3]MEC5175579.1 NAD(P)-dependent dehydrogenase (short-subunit alcohol dehydrogenase family) [Cryobacterium sp. MP_M5]
MTNSSDGHTPNIVLITGTSSGIGLHAAIAAARAGHTVVATMRNLEGSRALRGAADAAGVTLDIRRLDVTEAQSVTEVVAEIVGRYGRLDAVLNNAGSGHLGTIENETIDQVRAVMEVNFFGVVAVTRAALPHLRTSHGRLITVTSVGGVIGQPFNEAYCAAKFAVEGFMESLAPVARSAGVSVTVVEPGAVATSFVANVGFDPAAPAVVGDPYAAGLAAYLARAGSSFASAQSAESAGSVVAALLDGDVPPFRVQTSDAARQFVGVKLADPDGSAVQRLTGSWIA